MELLLLLLLEWSLLGGGGISSSGGGLRKGVCRVSAEEGSGVAGHLVQVRFRLDLEWIKHKQYRKRRV